MASLLATTPAYHFWQCWNLSENPIRAIQISAESELHFCWGVRKNADLWRISGDQLNWEALRSKSSQCTSAFGTFVHQEQLIHVKTVNFLSFTNKFGLQNMPYHWIQSSSKTLLWSLTCSSDWRCSSRSLRVYWGAHCTGWIILRRSDVHWSGQPDSME